MRKHIARLLAVLAALAALIAAPVCRRRSPLPP